MLLQMEKSHSFFLWLINSCVCVYVYNTYSLSTQFIAGHLGCFHILPIVNNAAVNIGVHVSLQISGVFFVYIARSHMVAPFLLFNDG